MLVTSLPDDVLIVNGKLVIPDTVKSLLGRELAPTDNPAIQLRHLMGILDELEALATHSGSSFQRLKFSAAKQLTYAIQLQLSYAALLGPGSGRSSAAHRSAVTIKVDGISVR